MNDQSKRCTRCGETKPVGEFYLIRAGDPSGPRRSDCKTCHLAECARRRAEGESVTSEIIRVGMSDPDLLSEKARAAVFTEEPIDPALIAAWRARQAKEAKRQRRAARKLQRELELGLRPMRFARLEQYA